MGKKEEKQLLDLVGAGAGAGDKDKLLRILYPKQKPAQAAATLDREDVRLLRLTINVSNVIDLNITRAECGSTPLILACLNGHHELALVLLQHGADVNRQDLNGNTALHWAAFHDRQDMVDTLIKAKIKPNTCNLVGETPLHFIIQKLQVGRPLTLVRLLQGGAEANIKNGAGDTPLTVASRLNKIDAVSLLVDSCRELTNQSKPLIEAAKTGRLELSEVLLDCGFDPNGLDPVSGSRPLHEAVQFCRSKVCKLLIQFGADSMMKDAKGNTAESLARMLPGNRGPEYLRMFDKGRELQPRMPRVEKEREKKKQEQKAKEVTENLPLLKMFTQWTRNSRPYRSRSDPINVVFNLFNNSEKSRYTVPRGRHNWITFDFGSKFILNGVRLKGWDSPETIKNFQILYASSLDGPWFLSRAFRANRRGGYQVFRNFVTVSQFVKFVITDNYCESIDSPTSFVELAFFGLDTEFKLLFGNMGFTKYDQKFIDAGHSSLPSLIYMSKAEVDAIVPTASHSASILKSLRALKLTYQYGTNMNLWWKTQPVCKCSAGQALPPFSAYVDSGVEQEFTLIAKGGCTLSGGVTAMSQSHPEDRGMPGVVYFRNVVVQPPGVYLLQVTDTATRKQKLSAYRVLEVGDSTVPAIDIDDIYQKLIEKLAFTQA